MGSPKVFIEWCYLGNTSPRYDYEAVDQAKRSMKIVLDQRYARLPFVGLAVPRPVLNDFSGHRKNKTRPRVAKVAHGR